MKYTVEFIIKYLATILVFLLIDMAFNTKFLESDFTLVSIVIVTAFTTTINALQESKEK